MKKNKETRVLPLNIEVRTKEDGKREVVWYPAVTERFSEDLGGFKEIIKRGAFRSAISKSDVRALLNHDSNFVLGRNVSGTLKLEEDENGLRAVADFPNTTYANDLIEVIERGDISQGSFAFTVDEKRSSWKKDKDGKTIREIEEVRELFDVSIVTYPAYPDTSIAQRSLKDWSKEEEEESNLSTLDANTRSKYLTFTQTINK